MRRRIFGRAVLVGAMVCSALVADVAAGQVALTPTAVRPKVATPPIGPERDGLAVSTDRDGSTQQSRVGLPSTNAVSQPCANSAATKTRLGLLENTALQTHCDGWTAP